MAAALPVLTNRDLNRAKNKKASDEVIPFVYETVIEWGCRKYKNESFLTYYNRRPKTKQSQPMLGKKWMKQHDKSLQQRDCKSLDATFLHELVPTICDGIGRYDPNALSSSQIEQYLREVKNIRNDICHDPKGASISGNILNDLEKSAVKVFYAAKDLYALDLDPQKVQDKIKELKGRLLKLKMEVMTGEQQIILQIAKKMSEDGMAEMQAAVKRHDTDFLPLRDDKVTRMDVFYSVDLLITTITNDQKETKKREIPSHELLEHFEGSNVLCEGQPWTGKTTLLKTMREDFGAETKERFRGVRKFDLLMYMECSNNSITAVEQLLDDHFSTTLEHITKGDTMKALRKLKLLICVDGLDELTLHTKKLLRELISEFGKSGNATFIFTSRPGQARSVSLNHETVTLQSIKGEDQQVEFLRWYQKSMKGMKDLPLIEDFKSLNETCKAVLRLPVYLALFCALYRESPQKVNMWENEVSLLNEFFSLSMQTMINRMDTMGLANPLCYAEDATTLILDLSLCLLHKEEITLTAKTYTKMCQDIFPDLKVDYYPIVSTFFIQQPDQQTFEFYNKSQAEFLAAKAIATTFFSTPAAGVVSTIEAICKKQAQYFQDGAVPVPAVSFKRFANVLRFVCMLIHERGRPMEGALQRFLEEVCPALAYEEVSRALAREEVCPTLALERVGLDYWTDLVLGCPNSHPVAREAANAAYNTWPGMKWTVQSSRVMTATSKMLPHRQPTLLHIEPKSGEEDPATLAVLLKAVSDCHTGALNWILNESHDNYSACDTSLACLESAKCRLEVFKGCLSCGCNSAWVALIGGVTRAQKAGGNSELSISLLDPMWHDLTQLKGTRHTLRITVRSPCGPGDWLRNPLPTSLVGPPELIVECRPAAGGWAPSDERAAALIDKLAPEDKKYGSLFLLHYPRPDCALDGMVATLRERTVGTTDSRTRGWEESERSMACGDGSSLRPGVRCVRLYL